MVDDSYSDIKVYKCWVCGDRLYVDHPKRRGSLVCSRCGDDKDAKNKLGYCNNCLKLLNINLERTQGRNYGETNPSTKRCVPRRGGGKTILFR